MWPTPVAGTFLLAPSIVMMMLVQVYGHGRLWEPPSRSSMWRRGYATPHNYQDMELFCGGVGIQYGQNGGKCGVCGDPWNGPRENEAGGKYANGIIVREYKVGQVIDVVIQLTANHKGYFEFHICPSESPFEKVTHECLAKYPLVEMSTGKVKYPVPDTSYNNTIEIKLRLPQHVTCRACLLQWKYTAGNSWGTTGDGGGCVGCGDQEQFYGCADVAIGYGAVDFDKVPTTNTMFIETEDTEWHFGIVRHYGNGTNGAATGLCNVNTVFRLGFLNLVHFFAVALISFSTS